MTKTEIERARQFFTKRLGPLKEELHPDHHGKTFYTNDTLDIRIACSMYGIAATAQGNRPLGKWEHDPEVIWKNIKVHLHEIIQDLQRLPCMED